jgi:glutaredoxin domain-containing cysteine-rich protein 1
VVLYTTTLRGIRKTFEDCNHVRFILQSLGVSIDERDVSLHAEFRQELKELADKPLAVPRVFIMGRYIGGAQEVSQLHDDGTLAVLVEGLPSQTSREGCDGCGGVRFVPCSDCNGSCKLITDMNEVIRCPECNENGLMRCPICD